MLNADSYTNNMKEKPLYFMVLVLSAFLFVIALGGGLFGQQAPWFMQWQHRLFVHLCHQMPDRSFWLNGQPMAVCSRCLGIYSGLFTGLVIGPVLGRWIQKSYLKKFLLVTVILNIVDVTGNIAGFWTNTLLSRFVIGFSLAVIAGLILAQAFIKTQLLTTN